MSVSDPHMAHLHMWTHMHTHEHTNIWNQMCDALSTSFMFILCRKISIM